MKRPLSLLFAAFLLSPACFAQSSVQIYGVMDVTLESARDGRGTSGTRLGSNSSNLGFRGSESLGNGYSAIFQIEGSVSADSGAGTLNTRDTYVGLAGPFGNVKLGLFSAPMRAMGGRVSFVPGGSSIANNLGLFTTLNGIQTGLNSRLANSLQYQSPKFNDITATVVYSPGENRTGGRNDVSYGTGINYANGHTYLGYAYESRRDKQVLALGDSNDWEHRIAARHKMGGIVWGLAWDRLGSEGTFGTGAGAGFGSIERDSWQASAMYAWDQQDLMVHYTINDDLKCGGRANTGQCAPASVADTGASNWAVMWHYHFSKRTMLQAFVTRISNEARALYDFDVTPVVNATSARVPGADPLIYAIGIRHHF